MKDKPCTHLIGIDYDYDGYSTLKEDEFYMWQICDTPFAFCPLCGLKIEWDVENDYGVKTLKFTKS